MIVCPVVRSIVGSVLSGVVWPGSGSGEGGGGSGPPEDTTSYRDGDGLIYRDELGQGVTSLDPPP